MRQPALFLRALKPVAPPRVRPCRLRVQCPEGVHEPCVHQIRELLPLFVGKARVTAVRTGVLQVNLVMGHVKVAAHDDRFRLRCVCSCGNLSCLQTLAETTKRVVPGHAMVNARKLVLRIRRVDVYEPELRKLKRADAAFRVQLGHA